MFAAQLAYQTVKVDEVALRAAARHVLHLDASHGPGSVIGHGAQAFFNELGASCPGLQVQHLRLWDEGTKRKLEYGLEHVQAKMAMLAGTGGEEEKQKFADIEELALQLASAKGLVVSAPMWNYGVPYIVKQYFDCVLHPGLTFRELPSGKTEGLLGGGRPLLIITSAGGSGFRDHLTPWLNDVSALAGFDDATTLAAANVAHGDRAAILNELGHDAVAAARRFGAVISMDAVPKAAVGAGAVPPFVAAASGKGDDEERLEGLDEQEGVIGWLQTRGGLSQDCLESLKCLKIDGGMFRQATADDWRNEELGLEDEDIARMMELQQKFMATIGDSVGLGDSSDR